MSNRTAAIAFAAITGCVSLFSFTSSPNAAPAAPKAPPNPPTNALLRRKATPAGAHWYYRLEKAPNASAGISRTKSRAKKAAATASADAAETDAPPPTKITPARQEAGKKPLHKSVANARAELGAGSDDDASLAETTWPPMPDASAKADIRSDNQAAAITPPSSFDNKTETSRRAGRTLPRCRRR
jgi:hypothetical protein